MNAWLWVAAGGAAGSVLRYGLGGWIQALAGRAWPAGTLAVNVVGSLVIGFLYFWLASRGALAERTTALLLVGLLGGFTTFSAFSLDTLSLWLDGHPGRALAYVAASVAGCLAAVYGGYRLAVALTHA